MFNCVLLLFLGLGSLHFSFPVVFPWGAFCSVKTIGIAAHCFILCVLGVVLLAQNPFLFNCVLLLFLGFGVTALFVSGGFPVGRFL